MSKKQQLHNATEHGFSLIELMVVVSIIGILIAIGLGRYNANQARSYDKQAEVYVNSAMKILKSLDDENSLDHDFEYAKGAVVTDTSNLVGHFPQLEAGKHAVHLQVNKTGGDIMIVSFHCHGGKKFTHDSSAYGEYIVRAADITNTDITDKCQ